MQVQLTITLALIAAAAILALICDFLRARNTQLKRKVAELQARNDSRNKPAGERESAGSKPSAPKRVTGNGPAQPGVLQRQKRDRSMTSNHVLSEWLIQRAVARAAQKTVEESVPKRPVTPEVIPGRISTPDRILKPFAVPPRPIEVSIDAFLWESLATTEPEMAPATRAGTTFELIQGSGPSKLDLELPSGMHSMSALEALTSRRELFTGLVISIGVNQSHTARDRNPNLMQSIESSIVGLLRESDFCCRVASDEFLLICSGPHGAEAQRRLSYVTERLWDFQLRTLGKVSILFSVGGIDVQRENLSDAIALAKERMSQTRRSRSRLSPSLAPQSSFASQHRRAV